MRSADSTSRQVECAPMTTTGGGKPGCEYCREGGAALDEQAVEVIRLGDEHRVVFLKKWSWKPAGTVDSTTDTAILHRMIWHPTFLGGFFAMGSEVGPNVWEDGTTEYWHGPYLREDIRPEDFAPLGAGDAARAMEAFLARPGYRKPLPKAAARLSLVQRLAANEGQRAHTLRMPAEARQHSLGYLVSEPGFYFEDIVLIDHRIRAVSEVVLFIDY